MRFSIIYSFDIQSNERIADYQPPKHRTLWELTEAYVEDGYKHRKYAAVLNKEQFLEFRDHLFLRYECDTMGMIGAPGFGISHLPAVNFTNDDGVSAYICPVPDKDSPIYQSADKLMRYVELGFKALRNM